jgi:hypothetical protein
MSFTLAFVGLVGTIATSVDPRMRAHLAYVPFAFYTGMELLQGIQYFHVNRCGELANAVSTEVAYVLVIVQPLMWNALYYLRTKGCDRRLFVVGMAMAIVWMCFSVAARLLHGHSGYRTRENDVHSYVDSKGVEGGCTMRGGPGKHLYWKWASADLRGVDANWLMYLLIWFVPALVSVAQRWQVAVSMCAAAIAFVVTLVFGTDMAEFASLWCMLSVPMLTFMLVDAGRGLR